MGFSPEAALLLSVGNTFDDAASCSAVFTPATTGPVTLRIADAYECCEDRASRGRCRNAGARSVLPSRRCGHSGLNKTSRRTSDCAGRCI